MQAPTKYGLVVNLAKALGLDISPTVLDCACRRGDRMTGNMKRREFITLLG
jgi:hypothetical protein